MQKRKDHPFFGESKNIPEVIAHRGGAGEWPSETIYAFEQSVAAGVDILEMDIRYTSDGVPVLMHNRNVLETTGEDLNIDDLRSDGKLFKKADAAAYWWKEAGKNFPSDAQLHVPTLKEVFEKFRDKRMIIEIKPLMLSMRLIETFGRLIRDFEMTEKVLVASGSHMNLFKFRCKFPEVATSASVAELAAFRALKGLGYRPDCNALQLASKAGPLHFITKKYIDKAHDLGFEVHGWTVNEPEEMGRLISLKVDGIMTDHPTTLLKLLGRSNDT
ncbi:MAG: glycerophosphodiester phosphodiesterase [Pyrinomonadaceae bacterium]